LVQFTHVSSPLPMHIYAISSNLEYYFFTYRRFKSHDFTQDEYAKIKSEYSERLKKIGIAESASQTPKSFLFFLIPLHLNEFVLETPTSSAKAV
jgi:hypothetical protein